MNNRNQVAYVDIVHPKESCILIGDVPQKNTKLVGNSMERLVQFYLLIVHIILFFP